MAHPNEVPDHLKEPDHLVPKDQWERIRADAAKYAAEDTDDLDVPEPEPEDWVDDDPDKTGGTPDEVTREETLQW